MLGRDCRTVSGIGQSYYNSQVTIKKQNMKPVVYIHILFQNLAQTIPSRSIDPMPTSTQRSHSAAPVDHYQRRGSLSPPDHRADYSIHSGGGSTGSQSGQHQHSHHGQQQSGNGNSSGRFQSRSATATPTGSPKKRQLPQVPHSSSRSTLRDRLAQDFEERGGGGGGGGNGGGSDGGRFSRHRGRQSHHHQQTYRSTGMGGWERHYAGLSDSDLTMRSLEPRLRPRNSLSPDKDFMGDFGDSDMESVVSVTSSAFSTQSERPQGSRGLR